MFWAVSSLGWGLRGAGVSKVCIIEGVCTIWGFVVAAVSRQIRRCSVSFHVVSARQGSVDRLWVVWSCLCMYQVTCHVSVGGVWRQDVCGVCNDGGEQATMSLCCVLSQRLRPVHAVFLGSVRAR